MLSVVNDSLPEKTNQLYTFACRNEDSILLRFSGNLISPNNLRPLKLLLIDVIFSHNITFQFSHIIAPLNELFRFQFQFITTVQLITDDASK